ncbi:hypothetical protein ETSB_1050 [cyanobacterium endosymbiont of Epithemia turgida isolate EtSB Lake Yunoko]|nr:hypothetical protein ETSB_1050 [cyanobacterium endosymbiont of Epithemia turgida isolate EtSB Lake Yunoko]
MAVAAMYEGMNIICVVISLSEKRNEIKLPDRAWEKKLESVLKKIRSQDSQFSYL